MGVCKQKFFHFYNKHKRIKYIYKCLRGFFDADFVQDVNSIYGNMMIVRTECRGEKNKGKVIYDLSVDERVGFFAVVNNYVLPHLWYADSMGMYPVISLSSNFLYFEKNGINGVTNPWEYYFRQYAGVSMEDLEHSFRVACFEQKDFSRLNEKLHKNGYINSEEYIAEMGRIYNKYIHLNDFTKEKIEQDISIIFADTRADKILGVHIRMGGMLLNWDGHPKVPTVDEYIEEIRIALKKGNYEKIFLATDGQLALDTLQAEFQEKLIYYKDVIRSSSKIDNYDVINDRPYNNYLNGYEVLRDMYTLGYCGGLISGLSQVSITARIMRAGLNKDFSYKKIINKGINNNSMSFASKKSLKQYAKEVERQKENMRDIK